MMTGSQSKLACLYVDQCCKQCPQESQVLLEFAACLGKDMENIGHTWEGFVRNTECTYQQRKQISCCFQIGTHVHYRFKSKF